VLKAAVMRVAEVAGEAGQLAQTTVKVVKKSISGNDHSFSPQA